jgi:hypothetical protein
MFKSYICHKVPRIRRKTVFESPKQLAKTGLAIVIILLQHFVLNSKPRNLLANVWILILHNSLTTGLKKQEIFLEFTVLHLKANKHRKGFVLRFFLSPCFPLKEPTAFNLGAREKKNLNKKANERKKKYALFSVTKKTTQHFFSSFSHHRV